MINVEQLNETIDGLEKEIQNIKSISQIYKRLENLYSEVKANKESYDEIIRELSNISEAFKGNSLSLSNAAGNFNIALKEVIEKYTLFTKEELNNYNKLQIETNEKLCNAISQIENLLQFHSEKMNKEMVNQLERNERSISNEIKNLNYGIQNAIMNFITTKFESIDNKLETKQKIDQANDKTNKILLTLSLIISVVSLVIVIIK